MLAHFGGWDDNVPQSTTPVLLCTTKYYSVLQSTTRKYYSSTTFYYKVQLQYYSVLLQYYSSPNIVLRLSTKTCGHKRPKLAVTSDPPPLLLCYPKVMRFDWSSNGPKKILFAFCKDVFKINFLSEKGIHLAAGILSDFTAKEVDPKALCLAFLLLKISDFSGLRVEHEPCKHLFKRTISKWASSQQIHTALENSPMIH